MDGIKVSYIQYFNPTTGGIKFHDQTWLNLDCIYQQTPNQTCQTGCQPGMCTQETGIFFPSRALTSKGAVRDVVARLKPTDVILNVGYHGGGIENPNVAEFIGSVFKDELRGEFENVVLHWKMTTQDFDDRWLRRSYDLNLNAESRGADILKNKYGWRVYDSWLFTGPLKLYPSAYLAAGKGDDMHFAPSVYPDLNRALAMHLYDHS